MTAADCGQRRLSDGFLLLALAEGEPLARRVELGVTVAGIRAAIEARSPRRRDRVLLASLGIDLDEVRRRAVTATRSDDPARWRLRRSPVRPLRVTLSGPAAEIVLDEGGRKVIEVARWASRHPAAPHRVRGPRTGGRQYRRRARGRRCHQRLGPGRAARLQSLLERACVPAGKPLR